MQTLSASVIIITMNRPEEVDRCLNSFYSELPPNCDVIVVDSSKDGQTAAVVQKFGRARHIPMPAAGMPAARNAGIRASDKEIVVFMDDDAVAQPGWLGGLLDAYTDPGIQSVVGAIREDGLRRIAANQPPSRSPYGPFQPITNWQQDTMVEVPNGQGGNMSFRRTVLEQIGLCDENFLVTCHGEDTDVFVRLRRSGGRILYNPRAVVIHRPGAASGYVRSSYNRRFMFWLGRNDAYGNTKLFLGRSEFFRFFLGGTLRFLVMQFGRLLRAVLNNFAVTVYHLAGRICGFGAGLKYRWRQHKR